MKLQTKEWVYSFTFSMIKLQYFLFQFFLRVVLHALDKGAEGFNLCPKQQVSKLSVGKEDNEEHDGEAQDVFGTATQCGGQLSHGLVETDVFENLEEYKESQCKYAYPEPDGLVGNVRPVNTLP